MDVTVGFGSSSSRSTTERPVMLTTGKAFVLERYKHLEYIHRAEIGFLIQYSFLPSS